MSATVISAIAVLLVALAGALIAWLYVTTPDIEALRLLVLERWWLHLNPEPVERAAYIAGLAALIPSVFASVIIAKRAPQFHSSAVAAFAMCGVALVTLCFANANFLMLLLRDGSDRLMGSILYLQFGLALVITGFVILTLSATPKNGIAASPRVSPLLAVVLSLPMVVVLAALRIRSADMLYDDLHFEAVFYSVSQVVAGKTALADFPVQYGLYAELLGPILKLTGISVLGFTLFLCALQALLMLALIAFLAATIRSPVILFIGVFTVFMLVGNTWTLIWRNPAHLEYFQIWPVRMLFPSLIVAGFSWSYRRGMKTPHVFGLAVLAAIGVIWNMDWGLPVLAGLIFCFFVRWLFQPPSSKERKNICILLMVPLLIWVAFAFYLATKSGGTVDWRLLLKYQTIFYGMGFGMLPLPLTPHPWMVVLAVYLYGLILGISAHYRAKPDLSSDAVMLLSVIGLGTFTYYQGRSHDVVLSFVIWPAALIAFVLCDSTIRAVRLRRLPKSALWLTAPIVLFGVLLSSNLVVATPSLVNKAATAIETAAADRPSTRTVNVAFIKERIHGAHSAVILAPGQSILYAETGLGADVSGPGEIEMLLVADRQQMLASLLSKPTPYLFVNSLQSGGVPAEFATLLGVYQIMDESPAGLLYLNPKGQRIEGRDNGLSDTPG